MLKKVIVIFLALVILGCVAIATNSVFLYILCFAALAVDIFLGLLVLATKCVWRILPENFRRREKNTNRLNIIIIFSVGLFVFLREILNEKFFFSASGSIRLLGNTLILVFVIFTAWSLIIRSSKKIIVARAGVFVLLIGLMILINSLKSGTIENVSQIDKLRSIGYVGWIDKEKETDKKKEGVTVYDSELAHNGINIYTPGKLPIAYLVDMEGNVLHKYKWPEQKRITSAGWQHVELYDNGDLIAVQWDGMLIRMDWNSNITWKKKMRAHHDTSIDENGKIYVLGREDKIVFCHYIPVPIVSDYIAILTPEGKTVKKIHVYDVVKEYIPLHRISKVYWWILKPGNLKVILSDKLRRNYACRAIGSVFDFMHTNNIEIIDRDIDGLCKRGDYLVSVHALDLVVIIDAGKEEFIWSWGPGELDGQHNPTFLKNGNILIFDNGRHNRDFSRVIELNPISKKIEWEYKTEPPKNFFSSTRGSCQRLPNDNTLITESNRCHVFEVTKEGKVVWEFYPPDKKSQSRKRATIYRMTRIDRVEDSPLEQRISRNF